jgi:hypothetical protein
MIAVKVCGATGEITGGLRPLTSSGRSKSERRRCEESVAISNKAFQSIDPGERYFSTIPEKCAPGEIRNPDPWSVGRSRI